MKNVKKVFALMLAFAMVLAMSATVFAVDPADYSITVTNAKAGETYSAYKMLDLSVNDPTNPTAYRYTVNPAWADFADTAEFKAVYTIDDHGYVTSTVSPEDDWSADSALSILGEKAAAYAKENNITPAGSVTIADGADSGKIELAGAGYYVVTSTLGTRAMIETTPAETSVTIHEKNATDTIEKVVQEDSNENWGESNDAQIGDTVNFRSKVTVVPRSVNVVVHDKMTDGLTFSGNSSVKLWTNEDCTTALDASLYTIKATPDSGDTFTVVIDDAFAAETTEDAFIWITYSAVVNTEAVDGTPAIVDQKNTTRVSFGDDTDSADDETTTTTHKFNVFKHKQGEETKPLPDAVFQLRKGDTTINLIKLDANNYQVADATEGTGTPESHANNGEINVIDPGTLVSDFVSVSEGDIVIWGVDSDEYSLVEIQAPKGYNMTDPVSVTVNSDNSTRTTILNNTGAELPSTGGIGTIIFYVVGAALVIGCGVVLVSRKRVSGK